MKLSPEGQSCKCFAVAKFCGLFKSLDKGTFMGQYIKTIPAKRTDYCAYLKPLHLYVDFASAIALLFTVVYFYCS